MLWVFLVAEGYVREVVKMMLIEGYRIWKPELLSIQLIATVKMCLFLQYGI